MNGTWWVMWMVSTCFNMCQIFHGARGHQADRARPALAVGFVGATSAGKSWLVGVLSAVAYWHPMAGFRVLPKISTCIHMYNCDCDIKGMTEQILLSCRSPC